MLTVAGFAGSTVPASASALIVNSAQPVTDVVTVQPIIVSDNDGANTANFFGDSSQQSAIKGFIDTIWAQAGIDVNFLNVNTWDNTFANWGTDGPTTTIGSGVRPESDLNQIVTNGTTAGVTHTNPNVINMFFVRIAAGFGLLGDNSAAGLATLDGNGVTQYVGTNLLGFDSGRETIASVVAHEIGHNLGLDHNSLTENLLSQEHGQRLNSDQTTIALNSNLSVPVSAVPVPPAVILFLSGLDVVSWFGRRRQSKAVVSSLA